MSTLIDAVARERIATDLASTLVVEAAAGTGKTTALVERILSLLGTGTATLASGKGDLVAVTFTEKAAGEMKLRLRTEIERARALAADDPAKSAEHARLDHALEQLEAARIGTIHAFCSDILRERPVEARIDPLFEVAAEDEQERLYDEAFTQWFQRTLARPSTEVPGVTRVLRRATRERDQDGPRAALRKAGRTLVEQRDFPTPYERPDFRALGPWNDRAGALDAVVARLKTLAELVSKGFPDSWLTKSLVEIQRVVWEIERREQDGEPRDYDAVEAAFRTLSRARLWGWKGSGQWFNRAEGIERQEVLNRRAAAKEELCAALDAADADLAAALFGELWGIVETYERIKKASGKLDFLDLLVLTRELLATDASVRGELQRRFGHLLVDEFQDTDPLQAQILFLLAADDPSERDPDRARVIPGKLFLVGDPKQSIYRFRRADVSLYEGIKARLAKDGAAVLELTTSFRSAPAIQKLVNAAFAPLMPPPAEGEVGPRSQATYVPLAPFRPDPSDRPSIIALPVPRPYGDYKKIVQWKIQDSLPDAVGAFVDWLVRKSGWTITERGSDAVTPIRSQHVCLLFKRLQSFGNDVTRPYVRALEARRIPHVLVGGRSFHEREEVIALRNALAAIEWPDDGFSVYATLHGPFFALGDDALLAFKHTQRHLHPLRKRDDAKLTPLTAPVARALDDLARLHVDRNRSTVADTISRLLETTRAHAGVAIWPAGEQALGNILRVLDMARRFEQGSVTSFRAFVSRLEDDAERGGVNEAPVVEEGTDGVRIMTVHKAKGLEFPIVILVDPTANATFRDPSRHVDAAKKLWAVPLCGASPKELLERRTEILRQDREEAHRLLYVATTRARELLVVPVVGDDRDDESDGWLDPLASVLYPRPEERRASQAAPGCPAFGEDTVFWRPDNVERGADWSVRPGLHRPAEGEHRVVFWDPHVLELDKEDEAGLRHQKVLTKGPAAAESERQHSAWREARTSAIARSSAPSMRIRTVTEMKGTGPAADVVVESTTAVGGARPHGKRFGILVHAVLATAALDADDAALADAARIQGRLAGATEEEITAARTVVRAALGHPLLARARAAERSEREVALMLVEDDGSLVEGIADLAFFEKGAGWTVVDFKTDVDMGGRRSAYAQQVAVYARAIAAATNEPARGALLLV